MTRNGISHNHVFCAKKSEDPLLIWTTLLIVEVEMWSETPLFPVQKQDLRKILTSQSKYGLQSSAEQHEMILHASFMLCYYVKSCQAAVQKFNSTVYLIFNYTFSLYREK